MIPSGAALALLDRDGVLVAPVATPDGERPPWDVSELRLLPGAADGVTRLAAAGFVPVIVTNQPDVARGQVSMTTVEAIHAALRLQLPVAGIYVCVHDNADACTCRKPLPGLVRQALTDHDGVASRSWLIGDRWTDVAAGRAAGVRTVLIERTGSWAPTSAGRPPASLEPDLVARDIAGAVDDVLSESAPDGPRLG